MTHSRLILLPSLPWSEYDSRRTDVPPSPQFGYHNCVMTKHLRERIMRVVKKPLTAILDWLWDRLTYLVMSQGR